MTVPRLLFYSADGYGLGHINLALMMLRETARLRPDATILLVTGSQQAHAFALPPNADYLKLPAIAAADVYDALPAWPGPVTRQRGVVYARESLLAATMRAFQPDVVFVDWFPAGRRGEMKRALRALRETRPDARLLCGLSDVAGSDDWLRELRQPTVSRLLDERYDRIIVYSDQVVSDPVPLYGFGPRARAKTAYAGYLRGPRAPRPAAAVRAQLGALERTLIVVTVGGGADGANVLDAYLAALRNGLLPGVVSFIITGPLLERAELERVSAAAAALTNVTTTPFTPDLIDYLNAADGVVMMGGYSTSVDVIGLGKPSVTVPRVKPWEEQLHRAQRFARLGLTRLIHPHELTPERLARELRATLATPTPSATIDMGGVARAGALIAGALPSL